MTLRDIYSKRVEDNGKEMEGVHSHKTPVISFEVFPPKNDEDGLKLEKLIHHLGVLKKYNPAFISLTYGAGGTTQSNSLEIIKRIQKDLDLNIMPHFTCVNTSKIQVNDYLNEIDVLGIKNILALRGDMIKGMEQEYFDFKYANELVEFIKSKTELSIGVAGYPEGHIDCKNMTEDLKNLKRKVYSGADAIYTQMFFDNDNFFRFVDLTKKVGIEIPVVPGILPIMSFGQLERMLSMAKVTIPNKLMMQLEKHKDNSDDIKKIGIEFASSQCQQLIELEVPGLHFYTLNTSSSVSKILDNLGI